MSMKRILAAMGLFSLSTFVIILITVFASQGGQPLDEAYIQYAVVVLAFGLGPAYLVGLAILTLALGPLARLSLRPFALLWVPLVTMTLAYVCLVAQSLIRSQTMFQEAFHESDIGAFELAVWSQDYLILLGIFGLWGLLFVGFMRPKSSRAARE